MEGNVYLKTYHRSGFFFRPGSTYSTVKLVKPIWFLLFVCDKREPNLLTFEKFKIFVYNIFLCSQLDSILNSFSPIIGVEYSHPYCVFIFKTPVKIEHLYRSTLILR